MGASFSPSQIAWNRAKAKAPWPHALGSCPFTQCTNLQCGTWHCVGRGQDSWTSGAAVLAATVAAVVTILLFEEGSHIVQADLKLAI